jgi:chromosome segregation ATPase
MPFTVSDFHDLVRLLEQHPEWRAELRRLVLTEELLSLPALVRELAEAQRGAAERLARLEEAQIRTEERLARLEEAVIRLTEAQQRTDERLARLEEAQIRTEERLARLEEAQIRTEERLARLEEAQIQTEERLARLEEIVAQLAEAQRRTEETLQALIRRVDRIDSQVAELRGENLERRYRERAGAYFGRLLRRVTALTDRELGDILDDAEEAGRISMEEAAEIRLSDVVVRGRRRTDSAEVYLVAEVSAGVGPGDVERAIRRAELFGKALGPQMVVLPAVAGEQIMPDAARLAQERGVQIIPDGRTQTPQVEDQPV